jgi:hypothetical protein
MKEDVKQKILSLPASRETLLFLHPAHLFSKKGFDFDRVWPRGQPEALSQLGGFMSGDALTRFGSLKLRKQERRLKCQP